jgi:aspartate/methionine/tyrosine aminotransferase
MIKESNRLNSVKEYYFSKKLREVAKLIQSGKSIINMGIGSPDLFPSKSVIDTLKNSLKDQGAHKYQSYQGLLELRKAISKFYLKFFDVQSNPVNEVLPLMGSKEGIMHISLAFLNPGDEVLIPNPGYPTYSSVTKLVEATPIFYDLSKENNWFPNLLDLEKKDLSRVKIMWINYPHMPTGSSATINQFKVLIDFSKKHKILLINDNPYSFILNNDFVSLLSIKNAKENCMELNSLSKAFNLSGWRVGMLLGSKENISSVLKVKSNMDSGMFYGIQKGAIQALNLDNKWFDSLNVIYSKRRILMWELASILKCEVDKSSKGLFVWAKLPVGINSSEQFINNILTEKNIFIAPGIIFGSNGEGYIRFSLCIDEEKIKEAIKRFK